MISYKSTILKTVYILFSISYDSAPLSASLLSDWLEVHRMTQADLESLQQELQLGSPMILSDTIPPENWPPHLTPPHPFPFLESKSNNRTYLDFWHLEFSSMKIMIKDRSN